MTSTPSTPSTSAQEDVLQAIKNSPKAMNVAEIIAETVLSETTVRTALKALEAVGKVQSSKVGQTRIFMLPAQEVPETPAQPAVPDLPKGKGKPRKEKAAKPGPRPGARREAAQALDKRLHEWMIANPDGMHGHDIAEDMGVRYNLLYIAIWRLHRDKIIEKARDGSRAPIWRLRREEAKV
jgi:hypothetical protein